MEGAKIRVLVIDDSLFMRTLISDMLNADPEIEVIDTAKDGQEALKKISRIKPDCITLDLVMSGWDGLTTLEHIMAECPTPVVILSAHSKKDADITIKCLNAGAISFVLKPSGELSLNIEDVKTELLKEVKAASRVNIERIKLLSRKKPKRPGSRLLAQNKIIIIGASTGGPQTLEIILSSLPGDFSIPIIILQHVPSRFFTESLAEHLNRISEVKVKIAEDNEVILPGKIYLAPAGSQMRLKAQAGIKDVVISLSPDEPDALTPSIDITMKSAAEIYNGNSTGIILSGMGHDGRDGMKAIKLSGGICIVQDESSLIFGMPKEVIDAGYADKVLPVDGIVDAMMEAIN